jgi:hypothetical protein
MLFEIFSSTWDFLFLFFLILIEFLVGSILFILILSFPFLITYIIGFIIFDFLGFSKYLEEKGYLYITFIFYILMGLFQLFYFNNNFEKTCEKGGENSWICKWIKNE